MAMFKILAVRNVSFAQEFVVEANTKVEAIDDLLDALRMGEVEIDTRNFNQEGEYFETYSVDPYSDTSELYELYDNIYEEV